MGSADIQTGDKKLDRQIIFWKIVLEVYTSVVITVVLVILASTKCG